MKSLSSKLTFGISIAIICIFTTLILLIQFVLPYYYNYIIQQQLQTDTQTVLAAPSEILPEVTKRIANLNDIIILQQPLEQNLGTLNQQLLVQLQTQEILIGEAIITQEILDQIHNNQVASEVFENDKLKTNFFVNYIERDGQLIVLIASTAIFSEVAGIVNQLNVYMLLISLVVILAVVWIWSQRVTLPLKELETTARQIARSDFHTVEIYTNDEIEELAKAINQMSQELAKTHHKLLERNQNLKAFSANISHEIKTPLALIKAYAYGIEEGLDDGTYAETIIEQTDAITSLVERLLTLSKLEKDPLDWQAYNFVEQFENVLQKYQVQLYQQDTQVKITIDKRVRQLNVVADKQKMEMVLNNLLSNAFKYTANKQIEIAIKYQKKAIVFAIKNGLSPEADVNFDKIWEPFYVVEHSRNKSLTGTGLGLSIVKAILDAHYMKYELNHYKEQFEFVMYLLKE
ncbi:MAG: sensor histidine kinase [Culicoidibacterales bacterium]